MGIKKENSENGQTDHRQKPSTGEWGIVVVHRSAPTSKNSTVMKSVTPSHEQKHNVAVLHFRRYECVVEREILPMKDILSFLASEKP